MLSCGRLECCCGPGDHMVKKPPASYRSSKASEKATYDSPAKPSQATHQPYTSAHAAVCLPYTDDHERQSALCRWTRGDFRFRFSLAVAKRKLPV